MASPVQVQAFRGRIAVFRDLWRSIDVRYIILRREQKWFPAIVEYRLSPAPFGSEESETFVDLPAFKSGRFRLPATELDDLLISTESGVVSIGGEQVRIARPGTAPDGTYQEWPFGLTTKLSKRDDQWRGFWSPEPDSASFLLDGFGGAMMDFLPNDAWEDVERRLLANRPSYAGIEDLAVFFVRANRPIGGSTAVRFQITAPLGARVDSVELSADSRLIIDLAAFDTAKSEDMRVVARGVRDSEITRFDVAGDGAETLQLSPLKVRLVLETANTDWIEGSVLLRGERVDAFQYSLPTSRTPNPRIAALLSTDQGPDRLRRVVDGDPEALRRDDVLEIGTAWVFQLCGFQVLSAGLRNYSMGSSPDLFAYAPYAKSVLVIEATARDLMADGKLVKLRDRADALFARLPDFEVVAVAVSGKAGPSKPELELANQLKVAVLTPADLGQLLTLAEANAPPAKAFEYVRAKAPR